MGREMAVKLRILSAAPVARNATEPQLRRSGVPLAGGILCPVGRESMSEEKIKYCWYQCSHCGKLFDTEDALDAHERRCEQHYEVPLFVR